MHAAQAREGWVVLVDGAPILPCLAQRIALGAVLEKVGYLADNSA